MTYSIFTPNAIAMNLPMFTANMSALTVSYLSNLRLSLLLYSLAGLNHFSDMLFPSFNPHKLSYVRTYFRQANITSPQGQYL